MLSLSCKHGLDMADVPGSVTETLTTGEHTGVPQPDAPNPSPATAAPSQDAVSVNNHLTRVSADLTAVADYVRAHLTAQVGADVLDDIEEVAKKIRSLLK
jgi:hypothetical protein